MKKIAFAILLTAFSVPPAIATGLYAGAKFGSVSYGYSNVTNSSQAGFGLLGGYLFNPNFALEIEYDDLGGFDTTLSNINGSSFGVSGVGFLPFNGQFSIFGKLGIASTYLKNTPKPGSPPGDYTNGNTGITLGFGGQYDVSRQIGLRLGIDIYPVGDAVSSTSTADMFYLGGVFRF